jgi:hypothetical protein
MKLAPLILILLLTYGCAAKKMALENADSLISHQFTKRLPLYSAQKNTLDKDIDAFLERTKPLAQYVAAEIDDIDLKSPDKIETQYADLEKYYKHVAKDFSTLMSKYMAKLDLKQRKDFLETLDDENREILKKEKENRIDQIEDRFKMFLGSVNSKQKQLIREYEDYFDARAKARLDRRVQLQQSFQNIFNQDISEASRITLFQEAFAKYQNDSLIGNKNVEILKKIVPTVTPDQREHFRKEAQEVKSLLQYFNSIEY